MVIVADPVYAMKCSSLPGSPVRTTWFSGTSERTATMRSAGSSASPTFADASLLTITPLRFDGDDRKLTLSGISTGALFRPINRGGRIAAERLGDDSFVRMLKARTQAAGIDPRDISGHSCRSSYVTTAVDANAPLLKNHEVTRYKSLDMVQVYSRRSILFADHSGRTFL
jgi:hypothetical protein